MDLYSIYKGITKSDCETSDKIFKDIIENKTVRGCLKDIYKHDKPTFEHSIRVYYLSILIGIKYWFNYDRLKKLGMAAVLHDVGKTMVDSGILNKPDALTLAEFAQIKLHSIYGCRIISSSEFPLEVVRGIIEHHERVDGTGYPFGLDSTSISGFGSIIAVADVFDAITSKRSYRKWELTSDEAVKCLYNSTGLDESVVNVIVYMSDNNEFKLQYE